MELWTRIQNYNYHYILDELLYNDKQLVLFYLADMKQRTIEKAVYAAVSKYFFRVAALKIIFIIATIYILGTGLNFLILNPLNVNTNKNPHNTQLINK